MVEERIISVYMMMIDIVVSDGRNERHLRRLGRNDARSSAVKAEGSLIHRLYDVSNCRNSILFVMDIPSRPPDMVPYPARRY